MSLENKIGYKFKKKFHLNNALIHPSYATSNFQVYEFLGDRVLGMIVAQICFEKYKNLKTLANIFSNAVNTNALAKVVKKWNIEKYFKHRIKDLSDKVYADIFEAIIAAIYLDTDCDYKLIFEFVSKIFHEELSKDIQKIDPKILLQEYSQGLNLGLPKYTVINESGKDHLKTYIMKVFIKNSESGFGEGKSKNEASKKAAQNLLNKLNLH